MQQPIRIRSYLQRPLVRRGRWRIVAYDLNIRKVRQFYECSFLNNFREPDLRIGRQLSTGQIQPLSEAFSPSIDDRRRLAMVLHRLKHLDHEIAIYSDDLMIV